MKKKVGGVRHDSGGRKPGAVHGAAPPSTSPKKLGGVRPQEYGTTSGHRRCECPGQRIEGNWTHSPFCEHLEARWKAHGATLENWDCYHGCPPVEMVSVFTHNPECMFWEKHPELTPF